VNSTTSTATNATHQPQRSRSSTKNGSTHSTYCSEYTLLNSRNAQIIAALTCSHG